MTDIIKRDYSPEQIDLIKNTVAKGATIDELNLFLAVCRKTGLDPFTRQIHYVKRKTWNKDKKAYEEVGAIQTGIDGYRAVAARTNQHAGTDDAVIEEKGNLPVKATVTVYRMVEGQKVPFTATARFNEYAQRTKDDMLMGQWARMPFLMISKCAEALALRKAFPNDLSGVYTEEEMPEIEVSKEKKGRVVATVEAKPVPEKPETSVNSKKSRIMLLMKQNGLQPTENSAEAWQKAVKASIDLDLTEENYDQIIEILSKTTKEPEVAEQQ